MAPLASEIAWVGEEPAGANAKRVLSRPGTIPVTLRFLAPIDPHEAGDRKTLAARSQRRDRRGAGRFRTGGPIAL